MRQVLGPLAQTATVAAKVRAALELELERGLALHRAAYIAAFEVQACVISTVTLLFVVAWY